MVFRSVIDAFITTAHCDYSWSMQMDQNEILEILQHEYQSRLDRLSSGGSTAISESVLRQILDRCPEKPLPKSGEGYEVAKADGSTGLLSSVL